MEWHSERTGGLITPVVLNYTDSSPEEFPQGSICTFKKASQHMRNTVKSPLWNHKPLLEVLPTYIQVAAGKLSYLPQSAGCHLGRIATRPSSMTNWLFHNKHSQQFIEAHIHVSLAYPDRGFVFSRTNPILWLVSLCTRSKGIELSAVPSKQRHPVINYLNKHTNWNYHPSQYGILKILILITILGLMFYLRWFYCIRYETNI